MSTNLTHSHSHSHSQAAQRGQKQAVMTQPDADDPCKDKYGDAAMVQSREVCTRPYTDIGKLDASWADKEVCVCVAVLLCVDASIANGLARILTASSSV